MINKETIIDFSKWTNYDIQPQFAKRKRSELILPTALRQFCLNIINHLYNILLSLTKKIFSIVIIVVEYVCAVSPYSRVKSFIVIPDNYLGHQWISRINLSICPDRSEYWMGSPIFNFYRYPLCRSCVILQTSIQTKQPVC